MTRSMSFAPIAFAKSSTRFRMRVSVTPSCVFLHVPEWETNVVGLLVRSDSTQSRLLEPAHQHDHSTQCAIQPRSTARLWKATLTAGSVRYEATNRRRRIPIGTVHARGWVSGASPAVGSRRSAGLRAHDTMTNVKNTSGGSHTSIPSPTSRCDATAPEKWKKEPAYAHSLSRGNLGAMIAAAPLTWHAPLM